MNHQNAPVRAAFCLVAFAERAQDVLKPIIGSERLSHFLMRAWVNVRLDPDGRGTIGLEVEGQLPSSLSDDQIRKAKDAGNQWREDVRFGEVVRLDEAFHRVVTAINEAQPRLQAYEVIEVSALGRNQTLYPRGRP